MNNINKDNMNMKKIKNYIIIFIIVGIILMAAVGIYGDYNDLGNAINNFNFSYLPLILILAPLNYCLRFVKWNYYLGRLGLKIDKKVNRTVFIAGLSMTITPAKIGEFFKSYLLKELSGIEMSKTAPLILMERLTDGISMVILASLGAAIFSYGWTAIIICFAIIAVFVAVIRIKKLAMFFIRLLKSIKFIARFGSAFENFYLQTYELMHPVSLFVAVFIGVISWLFEGFVIFFALKAFAIDIPVLGSIFTVSVSALIGAISMLPGGIFVAEGSILATLVYLFDVDKAIASATTIITRFSTLWLGVSFGIVGLIITQRMLKKKAARLGEIKASQ